ncbi:hypothetical protein GF356_07925 [candidate division GN15 bacterium]|nr:hypothetical protein [candidate division GN15 bacterium]
MNVKTIEQVYNNSLRQATQAASQDNRKLPTAARLERLLKLAPEDVSGGRHRIRLYRFLSDSIPSVSAGIWTWVRLTAAPVKLVADPAASSPMQERAGRVLERLERRLYPRPDNRYADLQRLVTDVCLHMYRDGGFGTFLTVLADGSGIDRVIPVDPAVIGVDLVGGRQRLVMQGENESMSLDRPDFYHLPIGSGVDDPFGRSLLAGIPFVAFIEQQLVDDMRRATHNAGYHRLHVRITPPERHAGESDRAYTDRINEYFDSTVNMIRSCQTEDNPVTWDNVAIEYIGPSGVRSQSNSWFFNHRAMIEEICGGMNLSPFLLGYSYGATTTWSAFKFDMVMRQVRSVQQQVAAFLEWIGNIELALARVPVACRARFDNSFSYQAKEQAEIQSARTDNLLKLHEAGLIDQSTAQAEAARLL